MSWRGVDQLFSKNLEISISLVSVHGIGEVCTCCLVDILACTLHVPSLPSFFLSFLFFFLSFQLSSQRVVANANLGSLIFESYHYPWILPSSLVYPLMVQNSLPFVLQNSYFSFNTLNFLVM